MPADIEETVRAVWIGTAAAVATAIALTLALTVLHERLVRSTRMRVLVTTVSVILSLMVFIIAGTVMMAVIHGLLNPAYARTGESSIAHVFVHPGVIPGLLPLVAIVGTWLARVFWKKRRTASRQSATPDELQCRITAARETGSPLWSFQLVNDGATVSAAERQSLRPLRSLR